MKKCVFVAALLLSSLSARTQTTIQEMYDFGHNQTTTTLEMFKSDHCGSTFFYVDIYHTHNIAPTDFYTEIARTLNFWGKNSSIGDNFLNRFSLHIEWNGGCGIYNTPLGWEGYAVNNAWLAGIEYFIANNDFSQHLTLMILYKDIRGIKYGFEKTATVPLQFTAVWGIDNLFGVKGLSFSGFADFWWENNLWLSNKTTTTFLTKPQIWYHVGRFFKCDNLNIGGEIEVAHNFSGVQEGWSVTPCLGLKWEF